jgi:hypothetical protein
MVNNKVPSPVFHRWLQPGAPACGPASSTSSTATATAGSRAASGERDELRERLAVLAAIDASARNIPQGQPATGTACGLSKVLALLCPDTVPLMDDAALWFALGAVAAPRHRRHPDRDHRPVRADARLVRARRAVRRPALAELAAGYALAPMSPAQILDRLLWFETWGYRVCRTPTPWWWVADGEREAIVPAPGPGPAPASPARASTSTTVADEAWRATAHDGLAGVFDSAA